MLGCHIADLYNRRECARSDRGFGCKTRGSCPRAHLLGLDHERLTYRYAERGFRLTDVDGNVVHELIA